MNIVFPALPNDRHMGSIAAAVASNTMTNNIDVVVHAAEHAKDTGRKVAEHIQKMLTDRFYHEPTQSR